MITDAYLIRRLGHEVEERLAGAKVRDVGLLDDGRIAIVLWKNGASTALCMDVFGSPPLLTVEPEEPGIAIEPGFVRTLAGALRGTVLLEVRARRGDRVLRLSFGSRNRFGVGERLEVYVELVPRFGNVVLVKGETVVAALKEFSPAENPRRPTAAGLPYTPPPARTGAPLPGLVARGRTAEECDAALALLESDAALAGRVYTYRRDGRVAQSHLLPLGGFEDASVTRDASLLEALAEYGRVRARGEGAGGAKRRSALERLLAKRETRIRGELSALERRREAAERRDALRAEGEGIYARMHEIETPIEREEAKQRAQELFASYKKLGASLPHLDARQRHLETQLEAVDTLRWEAGRASGPDLDEVERAAAALATHAGANAKTSKPASKRRKRARLELRAPDGSRVLVGRSPAENADLTFRVANPGDLWFHARGTPGAHVVLQRDDRRTPSQRDVEFAASLAAAHSKARASGKVPVDYTQRKHVRKRPDAPPGLVWYAQAKTAIVTPYVEPLPG